MLAATRMQPKYTAAATTPPVAGYVAWYDASDTASITESGGAVSQWNDKSSSGYHLTQSAAGAKPTTGSTTRNGLNTLSFDGGDNLGNASVSIGLYAFTLFVVHAETTAVNYGGIVTLHQSTGSDYNQNTSVCFHHELTTILAQLECNSVLASFNGSGLASWGQWTAQTPSGAIWSNGTANTPNTLAPTGSATQIHVGGRWVAGVINATYGLKGEIGEIIIYPSTLGTTDRESVQSYLKTKWGTP